MASESSPKRVDVAVGIVLQEGLILICRRRADAVLGGFWEFPGGKAEAAEAIDACLHRELREELDISVRIVAAMPVIEHVYPHACVRLHPFICELAGGEPRPIQSAELRWVRPAELADHPFPPANAPMLESLLVELGKLRGVDRPETH